MCAGQAASLERSATRFIASCSDFNSPNEKAWSARYDLDAAVLGVPGLTFSAAYAHGDDIRTAQGTTSEWERNVAVAYQVPTGTLKGLGVTWKNAHASPDLTGATVQDENRFYVSYVVPLW